MRIPVIVIILIIVLVAGCSNPHDKDFVIYLDRSFSYLDRQQQLSQVDIEERNLFFETEYGMEMAKKIAEKDCQMLGKQISVLQRNQQKIDYLQDKGIYGAKEIKYIQNIDRAIYLAAKLAYCPKYIQKRLEVYDTLKKDNF